MVSFSDDIKFFGKSVGTLSYFGKIFYDGSRFRFSAGERKKLGVRPLDAGKAELQGARGGRKGHRSLRRSAGEGGGAAGPFRRPHHLFASINVKFLFYKEAILDSNQNRCCNRFINFRDTAVPFGARRSKFGHCQRSP